MAGMWLVPVIIRILIGNIFYPWFGKAKLIHTDKISFNNRFTLHYFFAAAFGSVAALFLGQLVFDKTLLFITSIGAANGYAAYCQWKADQHSLSFVSITLFMDDVIAITLGYIVLNESKYLNFGMGAGLFLCVVTIIGLGFSNYRKQKIGEEHVAPKLFIYVAVYTVIWGFATFSMRYFALSDISVGKFVFGWYGGAFLMALAIFCITKIKSIFPKKDNENKDNEKKNDEMNRELSPLPIRTTLWMTAVAGGSIFSSIFLSYWALQLAPLTVVKPIFFVSQMLGRMILGLFMFDEYKQYRGIEKILVLLAVIGAITIALSFGG
ncbi:MAG: hypothetical protein HYY55_00065 [Candidatus Niyogibacteria bacterium]|nr:MAG: hypothetical protein HYY55_00065 [Candidatus Niyogibacteria bacterium]